MGDKEGVPLGARSMHWELNLVLQAWWLGCRAKTKAIERIARGILCKSHCTQSASCKRQVSAEVTEERVAAQVRTQGEVGVAV